MFARHPGADAGADVLAANANGEVLLTVAVSRIVPRGVALSHKARWLKSAPDGANVNRLNAGIKSDMGGGSAVHGTEIMLRPIGPAGSA